MKKLTRIESDSDAHWVGDGFPVRSLFSYHRGGDELSPFLLLDHAGPREFSPTTKRRGVGEHPHRGFETVTIVYDGEVEHRDSANGGGKIGPGDVQWMTAASGLVHEEFHGREFAKKGGRFEMVQLWVNLPAKDKMTKPRYQAILDRDIPAVKLSADRGVVRVIAGEFDGHKGPAKTFTPVNVWDVRITDDQRIDLPIPAGHTTLLVVLKGVLLVDGDKVVEKEQVAHFTREGDSVRIEGGKDSIALLLSGVPLDEPIVGQGPFVMNTPAEIHRAIVDYQTGKMGHLSPV
ncbi:MAG: pirin family protein [Planctomycetes bacterium]|nr:pirin family protein [Planctomycetota bacterium]